MQATEYITRWMKEFVEKEHPVFAGLPACPYARQARLSGRVRMIHMTSAEPDSNCWHHIERTNFDQTDALVLILDAKRWTLRYTHDVVDQLNSVFMPRDVVVLEDHPLQKEEIGGVIVNNGRYILLLCQRLSTLNRFSEVLKKKGYYDQWSKKNVADVVTWRLGPRSE